MPHDKLTGIVAQFGAAADPAPDAELLARFAAARDQAAFAELVRRHARLVFGVCRRVTAHPQDAEDAFQAVFLVLAAKASSVRPPGALAAWLHAVAHRTALRARTVADRRRRREAAVAAPPGAAAPEPPEVPDAVAALDEEVARLPERYRAAVVLCELQGLGRKDAAARLGIREGTLSSRLAAARKALAARLRRRGVALSAAGLAAAFNAAAAANPPAALAAGAAASPAPQLVPARVAALSHGVLRLMLLDKLKTAALLGAISLGLTACAAIAVGAASPANDPPAPPRPALPGFVAAGQPAPPKPRARPLPKGPDRLLFSRDGHLTLADPDGKNDRKVSADREKFQPGPARLSPDGKLLAAVIHAPNPAGPGARPLRKLYVRGPDEPEPGTDLGVECQDFFWSPHGDQIACSDVADAPAADGAPKTTHVLVDVKAGRKADLKLPAGHLMTDWSRDGRFFLTTSVTPGKDGPVTRLHLLDRDGIQRKALTDGKPGAMFGKLSPDNTRVLFFRVEFPPKDKPGPPRRLVCVLEVATGKVAPVGGVPPDAEVDSFCWSPDGKRIAYARRQVRGEGGESPKEPECALVVCGPDGKNPKTIAAEKGAGPRSVAIANVDWR